MLARAHPCFLEPRLRSRQPGPQLVLAPRRRRSCPRRRARARPRPPRRLRGRRLGLRRVARRPPSSPAGGSGSGSRAIRASRAGRGGHGGRASLRRASPVSSAGARRVGRVRRRRGSRRGPAKSDRHATVPGAPAPGARRLAALGVDLVRVEVHVGEPVALGRACASWSSVMAPLSTSTPATVAPGLRAARTACSTVARSAKPSSTITSLRKPARARAAAWAGDPLSRGSRWRSRAARSRARPTRSRREQAPIRRTAPRSADSAGAPDTVAHTQDSAFGRSGPKAEPLRARKTTECAGYTARAP